MTPSIMARNAKGQAVIAAVFWLVVWQLAAMAIHQTFLLASPLQTLQTLQRLVVTAAFWQRILFSTARILGGFLAALAVGTLLAACSAAITPVRILLKPLMQMIKAIPVASFIILVLLWVDSSGLAVLISFLMVLPVVYTAVLQGIQQVDGKLLEMVKVFRIPFFRAVGAVWIPQIWPYFVQSCTVGMGLAWKSGVAAEVIGLPTGSIGEALYQAKIYLETGELFAWTAVIVLISTCLERLLLKLLHQVGKQWEKDSR